MLVQVRWDQEPLFSQRLAQLPCRVLQRGEQFLWNKQQFQCHCMIKQQPCLGWLAQQKRCPDQRTFSASALAEQQPHPTAGGNHSQNVIGILHLISPKSDNPLSNNAYAGLKRLPGRLCHLREGRDTPPRLSYGQTRSHSLGGHAGEEPGNHAREQENGQVSQQAGGRGDQHGCQKLAQVMQHGPQN